MPRKTAAVLALIPALSLALVACERKAPERLDTGSPDEAAAKAKARVDDPSVPAAFRGDFDARGTEPFWAVRIRDGGITVSQPQVEPVTAPNNGPHMAGPQAVWAGLAGDEPVVIALLEQDCSDGMSDRVYPYAAEVQLGDQSFTGCAERPEG